jgi:adenylate kinase
MESQEQLRQGAVLDNQALLIDAFSKFRAAAAEPIIFDGHSVIDTGDQLLEIPVEVIRAIDPAGIVFVRDEPAAIIARRAGDRTRIRPVRPENEIEGHQVRAQALCEQYAEDLDVRLTVVRAGDKDGFFEAMNSILTIT